MQDRHVRWVEIIIAVSVVVISVASLFVAVFQSHVMQRQLEASVLPILSYNDSNYDEVREETRLSFQINNRGLGPAEIQRFTLFYEDKAYTNILSLIADCCVDAGTGSEDDRFRALAEMSQNGELLIITSEVSNALLSPGDELTAIMLRLPENEEARAVWQNLNTARWQMSVELCYCSVFDQCWNARFPGNERTEVRQCEASE